MADTRSIEVQIDECHVAALEAEADRLGVSIAEVVERATAAWLNEMAENQSTQPQ